MRECRLLAATTAARRECQSGVREHSQLQLSDPSKQLILLNLQNGTVVEVPALLANVLRPHQREGVKFMFESVVGISLPPFTGCILADDMGLGKTLQSITLMYTLIKAGSFHVPTNAKAAPDSPGCSEKSPTNVHVRRCLVVCPTSLVDNWAIEVVKWLGKQITCIPVNGATREKKLAQVRRVASKVVGSLIGIVSYDTLRLYAQHLGSCDLLICDEAHRLKNDGTLITRALDSIACDRRILLSGTPVQNDLDEFWALTNFCMRHTHASPLVAHLTGPRGQVERILNVRVTLNYAEPGIVRLLGSSHDFRKRFANPMLQGREPGAAPSVVALAQERQLELTNMTSKFILRRLNELNKKHLPDKLSIVVCCGMSEMQQLIYVYLTHPEHLNPTNRHRNVLAAINSLRKLVNHPCLLSQSISRELRNKGTVDPFHQGVLEMMPPDFSDPRRRVAAQRASHSGKMSFVEALLRYVRDESRENIVLVSNFTETLDIFASLCRTMRMVFMRLDGSVSVNRRQKIVQQFNMHKTGGAVFLLSSKAGGCGLNLIGGNRLVLFDPSWNPADDHQAAARIWREGQKRKCYIYRLLATGSIEEKIFQRQLNKEGLKSLVLSNDRDSADATTTTMSSEYLRQLFNYANTTRSDTHDALQCQGCRSMARQWKLHPSMMGFKPQSEKAIDSDLQTWAHHSRAETVNDPGLIHCAGQQNNFAITYAFSLLTRGAVSQVD